MNDPSGPPKIHVTIDERRCMANQQCIGVAPDIFELREGRFSHVVREVTEKDLAALQDAEDLCPTAAITVDVLGQERQSGAG